MGNNQSHDNNENSNFIEVKKSEMPWYKPQLMTEEIHPRDDDTIVRMSRQDYQEAKAKWEAECKKKEIARQQALEEAEKLGVIKKSSSAVIFIWNLRGRCVAIPFDPSMSIQQVRIELAKRYSTQQEPISDSSIRLIFAGMQLEDGRSLADYNIQKQSELHCVMRLRGEIVQVAE